MITAMALRKGADMSPAEVGLWLLPPVGLLVTSAVLAVSTAIINTQHGDLSRRLA